MMGETTKIAWTDATFNPWIGCTKISPGCKNCYAEVFSRTRLRFHVWGDDAKRHETKTPWDMIRRLNDRALRELRRFRVFMASMADFFEDHPDANRIRPRAWEVVKACQYLDFLILTKRSDRIADNLPPDWCHSPNGYRNVWLGVSIENIDYAFRADDLRQIPAVARFISCEPALGPLNGIDLTGIDQVIYGGESGNAFRQDSDQWARDILHACRASGTAFFFKQTASIKPGTRAKLDGVVIQEMPRLREPPPEFPTIDDAETKFPKVKSHHSTQLDLESEFAGIVSSDNIG